MDSIINDDLISLSVMEDVRDQILQHFILESLVLLDQVFYKTLEFHMLKQLF